MDEEEVSRDGGAKVASGSRNQPQDQAQEHGQATSEKRIGEVHSKQDDMGVPPAPYCRNSPLRSRVVLIVCLSIRS